MHKPLTLARTVHFLFPAVLVSVCLPALQAQSHDFATAIEIEGRVSVMQGERQVALWAKSGALPGQRTTIAPKDLIITGPDGHAVFQINDGSKFEVFPNSQVVFRDTYSFEDLVNVILGRIRVQVEHRNGPNHKKVSTPTAVISVRGTVFDVSVEDAGATLVSVEEGEVEVQNTRQPGPTRTVDAGNSIWIYPNQPLAKAGGQSPAIQMVFDKALGIVRDVLLRPLPGGGGPGGFPGGPGTGGQGDKGKKPPPTTGGGGGTAPPPPGGGGN